MILLPESDIEEGKNTTRRFLREIAGKPFSIQEHSLSLTLSIGLAQCDPGDALEKAITRADQALYQAKRNGKNRGKHDSLRLGSACEPSGRLVVDNFSLNDRHAQKKEWVNRGPEPPTCNPHQTVSIALPTPRTGRPRSGIHTPGYLRYGCCRWFPGRLN